MPYLKPLYSILFIAICFACNKPADLKKEEIYKIISEIFIDENHQIRFICGEFDNIDLSEYATEFDAEDITFYRNQKSKISDFTIGKNKIQSFVKGHNNDKPFYLKLDANCTKGIVTHLSFPLISVDRTKVIISIQNVCNGGMLCGSGRVLYYVKLNGKWILKDTYDDWIS